MDLLVFIAIVFAALLSFVIVIHHRRLNRNTAITYWPVVGNLPAIIHNYTRIHDFLTELIKTSGGTVEFKSPLFPSINVIVTSDPSNIHHIFNTNFKNYPKGDEFREVFDGLGDGILNADGDLWKLQRKMFGLWNARQSKHEFVSKTIQRMLVDDLIPFLDHVSDNGIQVDLQEVFQNNLTFDMALTLIFGLNVASKFNFSKAKYQEAFADMQEAVLRRHAVPQSVWKLERWLQIGAERKYKRACKIFTEFVHECVALRREEFDQNRRRKCEEGDESAPESDLDMMAIYLEEKHNTYSDKFLNDFAVNFMAASRDTVSGFLTCFFWLVATHPLIEAKILEELRENLPLEKEFFTAEDLNKLVYLQAALYETLRLYPSLSFNHKTAAKADTLPSGHHVKAKKAILISYYSMGRIEEIWGEDCLEFKPERWIEWDEKAPRVAYVAPHRFAAFSLGPRTCLGKDMAFVQTKVVAINVLKNYRLHVVEGHPIVPRLTITMEMKHGLKINVSRRLSDYNLMRN